MLFECWRQTLARNGGATALRDAVSGATHTFLDLQRRLDALPELAARTLHAASASAGALDFAVETLRAWRDGAVLCPLEREGAAVPATAGLPEDTVHLKLTSGSTGEPRCVTFRAEQLAADAENIRTTMQLDTAAPNLAVISTAHSYGFSNLILPLLLHGHPLVVLPDALPGSLRRAFTSSQKFTLPAVPAMWRAWWHSGLLKDAPVSLAVSAGAPLPLEVERGVFEQCGLKIHNFYGSSECGGIAYDRSSTPRTDASLAGTAMENVDLKVNAEGCLVVEGCNVGSGYWPGADPALGRGTFVTSDLVELKDGAVLMRGRVSDAINIAGRKLNPADVEAAMLACAGVRHCVVFGVPSVDAARCEETVACVNAGPGVTAQQLLGAAGAHLAAWQLPRRIWFCHELEPNARGKLPRAEWRAKWLQSGSPAAQ